MTNKESNHLKFDEAVKFLNKYLEYPLKEEAWDLIIDLPDRIHDKDQKANFLNIVDDKLKDWDDRIRKVFSSNPWSRETYQIIRYLYYYRRSSVSFINIAEYEHFQWLTMIGFISCEDVRFAENFFNSPLLMNLKSLKIHNTGFDYHDMEVLCHSDLISRISNLHISGDSDFSSEHLFLLTKRKTILNLKHLALNKLGLYSKEVKSITECSIFPYLESLNLSNNHITNSDIKTLVNSPLLKNLNKLNLSFTRVDEEGVRAIRSSKYCNPKLKIFINREIEV